MFTAQTWQDTVSPTYPCGSRGPMVSVSEHGVNYAVWKLQDDFERHIAAPKKPTDKPACKVCSKKAEEKAQSLEDMLRYLGVNMDAAAKVMTNMPIKVKNVNEVMKALGPLIRD